MGTGRLQGWGRYSPLGKPYCTTHHVNQPVCASQSRYTLRPSVCMAEERHRESKAGYRPRLCFASVAGLTCVSAEGCKDVQIRLKSSQSRWGQLDSDQSKHNSCEVTNHAFHLHYPLLPPLSQTQQEHQQPQLMLSVFAGTAFTLHMHCFRLVIINVSCSHVPHVWQ